MIPDYKDVSTRKLDRYAYKMLGRWQSTKGVVMDFKEDGTCVIDGEELYFAGQIYRVSTGASPDQLEYRYNITHMTKNTMTLREAKTKKLYKMTRLD